MGWRARLAEFTLAGGLLCGCGAPPDRYVANNCYSDVDPCAPNYDSSCYDPNACASLRANCIANCGVYDSDAGKCVGPDGGAPVRDPHTSICPGSNDSGNQGG